MKPIVSEFIIIIILGEYNFVCPQFFTGCACTCGYLRGNMGGRNDFNPLSFQTFCGREMQPGFDKRKRSKAKIGCVPQGSPLLFSDDG